MRIPEVGICICCAEYVELKFQLLYAYILLTSAMF